MEEENFDKENNNLYKFRESLEIDIENTDENTLKERLPEEYQDLIKEIKEDEEYQYLKNMPVDLINSTKEFNFQMYTKMRELTKKEPKKPPIVLKKETMELEILKCKYDIVYFAENYVKIPTVGGIVQFMLNDKIRCTLRLVEAGMLTLFMTSR